MGTKHSENPYENNDFVYDRKNKPNNDKILIADLDPPDDKKSKKKKITWYEFSERRGFEGIQTFNDGILFNEEKTNDENYIFIM